MVTAGPGTMPDQTTLLHQPAQSRAEATHPVTRGADPERAATSERDDGDRTGSADRRRTCRTERTKRKPPQATGSQTCQSSTQEGRRAKEPDCRLFL